MHDTEDSVICHICAVASEPKLLDLDTKREDTFITTGFVNWKKAKEKFQVDSTSVTHCHASELLSSPTHIDELMSDAIAADKKEENTRCLKILQNVAFFGRQGPALHGDGDDKSGNFYKLMLLRALNDPNLLKCINRNYDRHMSSTSQNEILKLLTLQPLRKIARDIAITGCYGILADEATNVSNTQQLVVCIQWVMRWKKILLALFHLSERKPMLL